MSNESIFKYTCFPKVVWFGLQDEQLEQSEQFLTVWNNTYIVF